MIQRKQSIFLFLSLIVGIACLCLPIGLFEPEAMGKESIMMNLWIQSGEGVKDFRVWPLFAILLVSLPIQLFAIFDFHKRKRQISLCTLSMVLMLAWYAAYAYFALAVPERMTFGVGFAACLPLVSIILLLLAKQGIKSDEALVRAADRIR